MKSKRGRKHKTTHRRLHKVMRRHRVKSSKTRRVKRAKAVKRNYSSKSAKYYRGKGKYSRRNLELDRKRTAKARGKDEATWKGDYKNTRV